jgi:hypothetical protein
MFNNQLQNRLISRIGQYVIYLSSSLAPNIHKFISSNIYLFIMRLLIFIVVFYSLCYFTLTDALSLSVSRRLASLSRISSYRGGATTKPITKSKVKKRTFVYMLKSFFISMVDPEYVSREIGGNKSVPGVTASKDGTKRSTNKKGRKLGDR